MASKWPQVLTKILIHPFKKPNKGFEVLFLLQKWDLRCNKWMNNTPLGSLSISKNTCSRWEINQMITYLIKKKQIGVINQSTWDSSSQESGNTYSYLELFYIPINVFEIEQDLNFVQLSCQSKTSQTTTHKYQKTLQKNTGKLLWKRDINSMQDILETMEGSIS